MSNDKRKRVEFKEINDVWDYIFLLKQESEERHMQGSPFKTLNNIYEQLPFFCCNNKIIDLECQEEIAQYVYCNETNTPAYSGSYTKTPSIWIDTYFIIKNALSIRENKLKESMKNAK